MRRVLGLVALLLATPAFAQAPPPIPDTNRTATYNIKSSTAQVQIPFAVFGSCTDLAVIINGVQSAFPSSLWNCASASGFALNTPPLPITDMVVNLTPPLTSRMLNIIGAWHPRNLFVPTAAGISRREFEQAISTIIAGQREEFANYQGLIAGMSLPSNIFNSVNTWNALQYYAGAGHFQESLTQFITDVDVLRPYCYQGDGVAHTLSSVTSCNGVNMSGTSLAQWQAVLPSATSLLDDIDGDAINSYIATVPAGTPIVVPIYGRAVVNTTITACGSPFYMYGGSVGASITQTGIGVTLFKYCQSVAPPTPASFHLRSLVLNCNASAACGDAIDVKLNNSSEPNFLLDTVRITQTGAGPWTNGVMTVGAGGSRITNSVITVSIGAIAGTCLSIADAAPFTVVIQVLNTHFYGCAQAEQVTASATADGIQGIFNIGVNADQVLSFFNYTSSSSTVYPPQLLFEQIDVSSFMSFFSVNGTALPPSDWVIRDGWFIQLAPTANSGAITPPTGLIDLGNSPRVTIDANTFQQSSGATFNYLINLGTSSNDWTIEHNYVLNLLGTINNGLIQIPNGATNILERENDFAFAGTRVVNGAWATTNVISESYIEDQSINACHVLTPNRRGTIGNRQLICSGSTVLTLAGTPGVATLTMPANIFGPSTTTNPTLTLSNGWTGGALLMCAAETPMAGTPPAATVICYSNTGGNVTGNVRVQWTAVGN
jgi:hypothetical protein